MELLEIEPRELKFTFELKKQSSCSVHLVNRSNEYVAFKVKTTSPKRYCVRPNTGVILPRSTMDFTVTMQAQKTAPPDMQLKDKFLIQSTIAPYGSGDEDIVPALFSKTSSRYVEEKKLRVVLVSPPSSPVFQPINGALKQEPTNEARVMKETPISKDQAPLSGVENLPKAPANGVENLAEAPANGVENLPKGPANGVENPPKAPVNGVENLPKAPVNGINLPKTPSSGVENLPPSNGNDVEDLKLRISTLELKLNEAEKTILTLKDENNLAIKEKENLQQKLVLMRRRSDARVQVGFPFLFVVFMAFVGAFFGYLLHQ